ncbi:MAG: Spermidine synthase [uncultured Acidimicrobiales bacterium]|uniref:Spermidine synthase n=1 Tax=uncultured Acidimicrobiales bacterium TaxID=310071 RepID=A0A6J4J0U5_9ACTN|nr:MAG: Spermidine synthase [uncultured Acidimicrobiales bacterium]
MTGFVLLDRLGTSGTIRLLAGLLVIPAVVAALLSPRPARRAALTVGVVTAMAVPLYLFPGNQVLYGLLHSADPAEFALAEERSCVNALIPRNGIETVYINGSSQNGYPYDEYHLLIGLLPALLHPGPERGMALGLGIGATPFGMAADQRLREIDTIEICGGQIDLLEGLAASGSPETAALLADERVDIAVGDGREHLLGDGADYDIITVDTLRPQSGYSGNLYSVEFYDLVRSRLADGGMLAQWAPTPRALETLTRSFAHVVQFTVPTYFNSPFLVASDSPIPFDRASIVQRLGATGLSGRMDPNVYGHVDQFVRTAEPVALTRPSGPAPNGLNRDLFPRDEYFLNNR